MNVDPELGRSSRSECGAHPFGAEVEMVLRCPVVFASLDHRLLANNALGVRSRLTPESGLVRGFVDQGHSI
ncbi:hypothetical protein [Neorhodopirellula pilleata]|uniref:hypothetical protein n=1 Tax=Neorhodopirellula pilleata TaxID=2714738 RepID=UPI0018CEC08B|nr:hypothetical protein [Neorhodopirellula pilleata]